jgi:hypothetical protein
MDEEIYNKLTDKKKLLLHTICLEYYTQIVALVNEYLKSNTQIEVTETRIKPNSKIGEVYCGC